VSHISVITKNATVALYDASFTDDAVLRLCAIAECGTCAFSALCVYSRSSSQGYLCAKFSFFGNLHCWASPLRKITYSFTQLIWCVGNWSAQP